MSLSTGLRSQVMPRFPVAYAPGAGVSVAIENNVATTSLDYSALTVQNSITDPSRFFTAVYNADLERFEQVRLDNLNVPTVADARTARGDAAYAISNLDRVIALTAALTAPRTWSLPPANSVSPGYLVSVLDEAGGIAGANILTLAPTGTDTLSGAGSLQLRGPFEGLQLRSNGENKWVLVGRSKAESFAAGSVASPSIGFTGDLTTGIWSPGAGLLAISTGGTERLRISSTGIAVSGSLSVTDGATSRTNLGLGGAAVLNVGVVAGTVAAGDDVRITGALQPAGNLAGLANVVASRTNLGLGGAAVLDVGSITGTVAAGDDSRITGAAQKASNLSDLTNATTARGNLGLGTLAVKSSIVGGDIVGNTVSNANLAQMAAGTLKGNNTAGPANAADLTAAQVAAMLFASGVVPANFATSSGYMKLPNGFLVQWGTYNGADATITYSVAFTAGCIVVGSSSYAAASNESAHCCCSAQTLTSFFIRPRFEASAGTASANSSVTMCWIAIGK